MRSKIVISWLALFVVSLFIFGCGAGKKWEDLPVDVAWGKIQHLYQKKRYLDAIEKLELFLINYAGSSVADSAQFLLAESHFSMKEYIIAASEYEKTVLQYPQSTVAPEAEYKLGLSFYKLSPKYSLDQEYTNKAIGAFQLFIEDYPYSERVKDAQKMISTCRHKLARKEYENGRLYSKMKEYAASLIYYDLILDNYYDTGYAPKAAYYKAEALVQLGRLNEAVEQYHLFLDKYGRHEWRQKAERDLARIQEKQSRKKMPGSSEDKTGDE